MLDNEKTILVIVRETPISASGTRENASEIYESESKTYGSARGLYLPANKMPATAILNSMRETRNRKRYRHYI